MTTTVSFSFDLSGTTWVPAHLQLVAFVQDNKSRDNVTGIYAMDVSTLNEGMYFLQILQDEKSMIKKVSVVH
jgi:hypothetical protein